MDTIDYWKLADHYSIVQAALLACGYDPQDLQYSVENTYDSRPSGYIPIRTALYNAIRAGDLRTQAVEYERDEYGENPALDVHRTLIAVGDLDTFFKLRGMICETFDRRGFGLTRGRPMFPPKLNAAIEAWTAVTSEPALLRGRSPKQALVKWLTEHAGELGLVNRDGKPNTSGIEEVCKVANWKPEGGAVPTPTSQAEPAKSEYRGFQPTRRVLAPAGPAREEFTADLDDEIPF